MVLVKTFKIMQVINADTRNDNNKNDQNENIVNDCIHIKDSTFKTLSAIAVIFVTFFQ